mmetsp:Transcript_16163/g.28831  ORF Transcript_16163/g.28831 Transcript_16163/m.28831 type:complete len:249 (-) Transcript_16163:742-1488(-)
MPAGDVLLEFSLSAVAGRLVEDQLVLPPVAPLSILQLLLLLELPLSQRLLRGFPPPITRPLSVAQDSHFSHVGSLRSVSKLPRTIKPRLARVIMTLRRRQSARKPTDPWRLLRTALKMMSSFSRPWKASTEAISNARAPRLPSKPPVRSTSLPLRWCGSSRRSTCRSILTWAEYGETTPTSNTDNSFSASMFASTCASCLVSASLLRDSPSRLSRPSTLMNAIPESCGQGNPSGGGLSAAGTPVFSLP